VTPPPALALTGFLPTNHRERIETLCDFCRQPQMLHMGFDHGKGKCLLARSWIDLMLCPDMDADKARDIVKAVNEWHEALLCQGAYI
jgi:hypothetical protein